jgi:2-dehydropantoate 2-reductase
MRITVFGAGAVGAYFGGRLAEAGQEVGVVARGAALEAIRRHGLRVISPEGDFAFRPAAVSDDPAELGPADVVLVGVKAWQVPDAARAMAPLVGADTMVVPLQNGVEAADQLARALGPGPVLGGLCRIIAWVVEPGVVRHQGAEPYVGFGELAGGVSLRAERLAAAFGRARGVTAEALADVRAELWRKFLFISSVSGIGAVTRSAIGRFRSLPETRQLLERALHEVAAVAAAHGVTLPAEVVAETLEFTDSLPDEGTTSMQRDIVAGRPSELESQSGAVVRLGRERGVATPVHDFVYRALLPQEQAARAAAAETPGGLPGSTLA